MQIFLSSSVRRVPDLVEELLRFESSIAAAALA
jgi:hypothetical protein